MRIINVLVILACSISMIIFSACSSEPYSQEKTQEPVELKERDPIVYVNSYIEGHEGYKIIDGDPNTGWISENHIEPDSAEVVKIDLGRSKKISRITLDDSFPEGFTNEKDPYERINVLVHDWDCTTWEGNDTPERAFDMQLGRRGFRAEIKATYDDPVFMMVKFSKEIQIGKIELDNDSYGTVPEAFDVLISSDGENYETILSVEGNSKTNSEYIIEPQVHGQYLKYIVYSQTGENVTLDEMVLYAMSDSKIYDHYPRSFSILVSTDDVEYEVISTENFNTESIITSEFEERQVRFIKYVIIEELGDNKPSLGLISVE